MSAHAQYIAVDGLLITYSTGDRSTLMFLDPQRDMAGNILKIKYSDLIESPTATHNAQKFLDSWAQAIKHSKLPKHVKVSELDMLETIQFELFAAWDWSDLEQASIEISRALEKF